MREEAKTAEAAAEGGESGEGEAEDMVSLKVRTYNIPTELPL